MFPSSIRGTIVKLNKINTYINLKNKTMKELIIRLTSPTPSFFKKIGKLGLTLTAIGAILVVPGIAIPAALIPIGGYFITGGLVAAALAKLPVTDDTVLPKE